MRNRRQSTTGSYATEWKRHVVVDSVARPRAAFPGECALEYDRLLDPDDVVDPCVDSLGGLCTTVAKG